MSEVNWKMLNTNVLVRPTPANENSTWVTTSNDKPNTGTVVAVSPEIDPELTPLEIGDQVLFNGYNSVPVKHGEEDLYIIPRAKIHCVL